MASASCLLLAAAVCLALLQPGAALRCWVCSSSTDVRCRDPFNSTRLTEVECERQRSAYSSYSDHVYCQKSVTTINGGERKVIRKCVYSQQPLEEGHCFDAQPNTDYVTTEHCSTCNTDLCNGAVVPVPAPAAAAAAAAASLALSWAAARLLA